MSIDHDAPLSQRDSEPTDKKAVRFAGWVLLIISIVLWLLATTLVITNDQEDFDLGPLQIVVMATFVLAFLTFSTVGAMIIWRQPGHAIGWLFSVIGFGWAMTNFTEFYTFHAIHQSEITATTRWIAWLNSWTALPTAFLAFTFLLLLFPNGTLLSRRWKPVAWLAAVTIVALSATIGLDAGPFETFPAINNPLGLFDVEESMFFGILVGLFVSVVTIACVVSLVLRVRRARGVERQQLKWFAFATGLAVAVMIIMLIANGIFEASLEPFRISYAFIWLAVAVATGIAILKHRLFDIDVIINRALIYGLLSVSLGVSYALVVILLQQILDPFTRSSDLAVAGSTLAVAALFQPARSQIQTTVDRRFYRQKYDSDVAINTFALQLREYVELDAVTTELVSVVQTTIQPASLSLWVRPLAGQNGSIAVVPATASESR